jgi:23S rRNA (cytosine1962-C5)-methyltransferase
MPRGERPLREATAKPAKPPKSPRSPRNELPLALLAPRRYPDAARPVRAAADRARTAAVTHQDLPRLVLAHGRERSLLRRHPWVFSGAVQRVEGVVEPGGTVRVCDGRGESLGVAAYNGQARIAARMWSFDAETAIDAAFFRARVAAAVALRRALLPAPALRACRLVHAENDGLPGVVVDRFGDTLCLQLNSAGAQRHREALIEALVEATAARDVFERSDSELVALEGLSPTTGPLRGTAPAGPIAIEEHGLHFRVDVVSGQKTGFYLDQRDNRALVGALCSGRDVLDAFCYSGGFALAASKGGARSVRAVDSSESALALAAAHAASNGAQVELVRADVFEHLRKARDKGERFDLIVLDPPKLAPTAALAERASRAYKDANLLACKLLRPGGLLVTFSCSSGISVELFQKIVAGAAADAGRDVSFVRRLCAGPDHPVSLAFPEGEYLKGLLCAVS